MNNGYPRSIIEDCTYKLLDKIRQPTVVKDKITTHYLKLPFYGHLSYAIWNSLDNLLIKHFPNDKFMFVFSNSYALKSCFNVKDKISP